MQLCVAGLSFKTAGVQVREKLSFQMDNLKEAYKLLLAKDDVKECVILSTCNRVEIYALLVQERVAVLRDFIRDYHKYSEDLNKIFYWKVGADALKHLCGVASGLDSMVFGESQIFGQVKDAYAKAVENGGVKHTFEYLFSQVFGIVKKIRSKTGIGEKNVSVSYAAVKMAKSIFDDIEGKKVMILGAGEMGKLTVRNLIDAGISGVVVANRTFNKAVEIAEKFSGIPVMLHEIEEYLPETDILISSISSPSYIINVDLINKIRKHNPQKSIFMIDISVPRSIDPQIAGLENLYLYNIDDLKAVVDSNIQFRQKETIRAYSIIEEKIPSIIQYLKTSELIPTLNSIRSMAEKIRKDGMKQVIPKMSISTQQINIIDSMTKSVVNKILVHSEIKLRELNNHIKNKTEQ